MGDALLSLGADAKDAQALVDGPGKDADDAAARLGKTLAESMDEDAARGGTPGAEEQQH